MLILALLVAALLLLVIAHVLRLRSLSLLPPLVPGGFPLIGNLPQLFSITPLKVEQWQSQCGPVFTLDGAGRPTVVLTTVKAASEVLDKMSGVTAGRPGMHVVNKLMTRGLFLAFDQYGPIWRRHRRAIHEVLNVRAATAFHPMQEREALLLCALLASDPSHAHTFEEHSIRCISSMMWRTIYGGPSLPLSGSSEMDRVSSIVDELMRHLSLASWAAVAEIWPGMLRWMPRWCPGMTEAERFFEETDGFFGRLAREACERRAGAEDQGALNVAAAMTDNMAKLGLSSRDIAWLAGQVFAAASGTSSTTLQWFVFAMVLHPEIAKRAQEEIDRVVGGDRPPGFGNREQLVYLGAVVMEVMRWRPVGALGIPHVATEDVHYEGYLIPKGTMILNTLWTICHDPSVFPNPSAFNPDRFLPQNVPPTGRYDDLPFGFGRRICVGRDVALSSAFITAAMLLWAFDFEKVGEVDEGQVKDWSRGALPLSPGEFGWRVKVRSERVGEVLTRCREEEGM